MCRNLCLVTCLIFFLCSQCVVFASTGNKEVNVPSCFLQAKEREMPGKSSACAPSRMKEKSIRGFRDNPLVKRLEIGWILAVPSQKNMKPGDVWDITANFLGAVQSFATSAADVYVMRFPKTAKERQTISREQVPTSMVLSRAKHVDPQKHERLARFNLSWPARHFHELYVIEVY